MNAGRVALGSVLVASAALLLSSGLRARATEADSKDKVAPEVSKKDEATTTNDWPRWRGPKGDNVSTEANWKAKWPEGGPKKLWEAQVGIGYSPVSVAGGRAYTMGNIDKQDVIWCFDAAMGEVLWKDTYTCKGGGSGYPGPRAQPSVDGNRVYTISIKGHLKCLSVADGDVIWEIDVRSKLGSKGSASHGHCESPLVLGKKLIVATGTPPATVVAFDKMTGHILWKGGDDPAGYATPTPYAFKGKQCLAVFTGTSILGMDAATGHVLWRHPWQSKLKIAASTPIVSDSKVFFCSDYGVGGALIQITDGPPREVWRNTNMSNHFDTCVLWKGYLYGFTPRGSHSVSKKTVLRCMDFATGEVKWSQDGMGIGTLMIADGKLIALSDDGELVTAEATSTGFQPISRAKVLSARCWTMPVLANGRIYCRDEKGHLVCLDVSK